MVTRFECKTVRVEKLNNALHYIYQITDKQDNNDVSTVEVFSDDTVVVKGNIKSIFRHMYSLSELPIG